MLGKDPKTEFDDLEWMMISEVVSRTVGKPLIPMPTTGKNPIIQKDCTISRRELDGGRKGGMPMDLTALELAARRVREKAEELKLPNTGYSLMLWETDDVGVFLKVVGSNEGA